MKGLAQTARSATTAPGPCGLSGDEACGQARGTPTVARTGSIVLDTASTVLAGLLGQVVTRSIDHLTARLADRLVLEISDQITRRATHRDEPVSGDPK